jgi:two-component system, OmpR family, alkaline phosphatase synthesis response regulator PhoP
MPETMKRRILIVDDDEDILDLLEYNLCKEGYEVRTLNRSLHTIAIAKKFEPDLIILDIMMPGENGIELCRQLREKHRFRDTYIFFLTARSESYYQHAVFQTGGDDYIEKVIGLKALTKKISAVLKGNYVIRKSMTKLRIGNLQLNRNTTTASFQGDAFQLSKPEFELLFFFAQNPSKNISVHELVQSIWGSETYLDENNVEIYIQNLKKKFGIAIIRQRSARRYNLNMAEIN